MADDRNRRKTKVGIVVSDITRATEKVYLVNFKDELFSLSS